MPRRGENVFKRKDGRWEARYVKGISPEGKKKYGSVYAETYKEVKEKQQSLINETAFFSCSKSQTIDEIMTVWLNDKKNRIKLSTFQKYDSIIANHISEAIGGVKINRLSPSVISSFIGELKSKGLSAKTVNLVLIVLNMGLEYSKDKFQMNIPDISLLKTEKIPMRVLSELEQKELICCLVRQNSVFSLGILIALFTGMRIGEICALDWRDIKDNTICVKSTMQRLKSGCGTTEVVILPPKSSSSNRTIPIPDVLLPYFEKYRKTNGFVIAQKNGKFTEPRLLQLKFEKIIASCGIEKANFHSLRHTFATRCVENGVDIKTLSEILGHSDVKTTLNKYVHSSFELKQRSINKLSFLI